MAAPSEKTEERLFASLRAYGRDAVSFQAALPGIRTWLDPEGVVAYFDCGSSWVAVGSPLAEPGAIARVAERFVLAARANQRRASFFACDDESVFGSANSAIVLGEQPWWRAGDWPRVVSANRRLREQLRRARAKGVEVRAVSADEIAPGTQLRGRIESVARSWLATRPMQPMSFLLTVAMFEHAEHHRYYVATRGEAIVAFASIVPIYAKNGWLVEDVVRDANAPNGTTELVFDRVLRDSSADAVVTWGLAPLSNAPWPMRAIGALARGLYDFRGLRAFKARLRPRDWQRVWLVHPRRDPAWLVVVDSLRAFADGSLVRFGVSTLVHRPLVLAWLLTLLLVPWTALLALLVAFRAAAPILGFPRPLVLVWTVFDALFAYALLRAFWRPRFWSYALLALAAAFDAALSILHIVNEGFGNSTVAWVARTASAAAPSLAALGLWRCALHTRSVSSAQMNEA